jgi:proprotein convertase subtilisin/kexin type 5
VGKEGCSGGRGSHLCGAGAAAVATHSPGALLGAGGSAARGRASERALGAGFSRGGARPLLALRPVVSTELQGRRGARGKRRVQEQSRESPRRRLQSHSAASRASRGAIAQRPAGPEPVTPSPLPQAWSKSLRGASCSALLPGSQPPTDRSRLRAPPAQAGEVSCARCLAREPAGGRRRRSVGTMDWDWGNRCSRPGRRDLLCVLALLAGCLLPVCRTRVYTNHWAVKIAGGFAEADRIASKYGFINVGQVTNPR